MAESIRAMAWFTMFAGLLLSVVLGLASSIASFQVRVLVSMAVFVGAVAYGILLLGFATQLQAKPSQGRFTDTDPMELLTPDEREVLRRYRDEPKGGGDYRPQSKGTSQPLTGDEIAALRALLRWNLDDSAPVSAPQPPHDVTVDA